MADLIYDKNSTVADRYVVQQLVGAGNFSYVYKVLDTLRGDVVALKVFKEGSNVLDHLRDEFHILKDLQHPHIARVFDVGQLPDKAYFLKLEYVEGNTLAHLIHQGRVSLGKAREIVLDLLDAVAYLHSKQVMHRDIKPNNIITNGHGAVIVDFNISKLADHTASSRVGTPRYMPPEVATLGWNWTGDLYAVGLVLYEMVTGHYPFDDSHVAALSEARDPRLYNPAISDSLADAILTALRRAPSARFQTARDMRTSLEVAVWDPISRLSSLPPLDLSGIPISPEEEQAPNYNPYLTRLLTLYSQSRHTNAGTRGLDAFANATYVPTRLDTTLKPAILRGEYPLVIITGNAGDGKTAFIQRLEQEVEREAGTSHFERLASGNGAHFVYEGRRFLTNYDGSQDEGLINNDDVLLTFFQPFAGSAPVQTDQIHIIAINEGRLVDFLQNNRDQFRFLYDQVRVFFEQDRVPETGVLIVNLNLRAVVADDEGHLSIFDRMVDRMVAPSLWERCQTCDIATRCYAKFNADSLNDVNYGPQIRQRLKALFQVAHFRQRLHITMRDLRSALAYVLFGTEDCASIHTMLHDRGRQQEYLRRFYYNAPFSAEPSGASPQDRLVSLLAQVDPGEVANPKLDAQLALTAPNELSLLPPFDARSDYDRKLLGAEFDRLHQAQPADGAASAGQAVVAASKTSGDARLYLASLRRKAYFERVDDDWYRMLPYTRFQSYLKLMHRQKASDLECARDDLVHALSLSEGIFHRQMGTEFVCLRTSQDPRVTIKSFRRFRKDHFSCTVRQIGALAPYLEFVPAILTFRYSPDVPVREQTTQAASSEIRMELALDLYEMLYHIKSGYTPSLNELRGAYINLLILKRQLASTSYDEVLLTEDELRFFRVAKTPQQGLVLSDVTRA